MKYRTANDGAPNAPAPISAWTALAAYSCAVLVALSGLSFVGYADWSAADVWQSYDTGDGQIFRNWFDLRLQRLVFVALIGATLAVSGVVFQAVLRNPLAEPYILGISGGASLGTLLAGFAAAAGSGVVAGVVTGSGFGAFVGAGVAVGCLLTLARVGKLRDPASLILSGVVLNAIFGALILLCYSLASPSQLASSLQWLMGSIDDEALASGRLLSSAGCLLVGLGLLLVIARSLDLLALSEEDALDLGVEVGRVRVYALLVASALTAVAVAGAGPIGFVGLIVPHVVRRLHGPSHRRLIPLAALAGSIFLMLCDRIAIVLVASQPLPIGVVTALLGGPFFLFLLVQRQRQAASGGVSCSK